MSINTGYPEAYVAYLAEYYGSRDYFECHEIMEEFWKENPESEFTSCWLVLIRISVCLYHARRGNWKGAVKLMGKAAREADPQLFDRLGVDGSSLSARLRQVSLDWSDPGAVYDDIELPITDERLLRAARRRCAELGYAWGIRGVDVGDEVIHRHLTRDRSDVVAARAESFERKALSRRIPEPGSRP
ncbi:DUF309 domain-containing protein [Cohnella terricola]|uniref:DUF309 domain-containing protein n=1 Tax=Cohnella terricola TaxID=1289167 RepID=A0A559JR31_9BACL|nr:DUF309 domain-containing protein [Cohnella terricola]TVY02323.1 DUF309 domain-containing protein [Cohnella terricola]